MGKRLPLRIDGSVDKKGAIENARPDLEAPRGIHDANLLRELVLFANGLRTWAAQFDASSPATLLAANMISHRSIDACMSYIGDALIRLDPFVSTDSAAPHGEQQQPRHTGDTTTDGQTPLESAATAERREKEQNLIKTLNYFHLLQEHVAGHLRSVPDIPYPYDDIPDKVEMYESWEPSDDETAYVVRNRYPPMANDRYMTRSRSDVQRTHDRLAVLGRHCVEDFIERMASGELAEGFTRMRETVAAAPSGARNAKAKKSLKQFEILTRRLRDLVPDELPGDPTPFGKPHQEFFAANLIEKFITAGRAYMEDCLPLLGLPRGSLQKKREAVLRRIAVVAQYAFLASSNGLYPRFAQLLAAVEEYARHLQEDASSLLDAPIASAVNVAHSEEVIRDLNRLSVEPRVLGRLRAMLGDATRRIGKIIAAIVTDDPVQATPWDRGDKVPLLSKAGLIAAKSKLKVNRSKLDALTTDLVRMQQVGLAVQVPLDYLLSENKSLPKRKTKDDARFASAGLPWIVNPLGALLADVVMKEEGTRKRRLRKNRPKPRDTTIAMPPTAGRNKSKKPSKKATPKGRLPGTKAAKKWPRA